MIQRTLFSSEHETFRDSVRRFMDTEVKPNDERWQEQGYADLTARLEWPGDDPGATAVNATVSRISSSNVVEDIESIDTELGCDVLTDRSVLR